MISRATPWARAMSVPTSMPSQTSANLAEAERRGSTAHMRAPLPMPWRTWWKKMGCAARALEPQRRMTSVSSIS
jgi:hypothetical protein